MKTIQFGEGVTYVYGAGTCYSVGTTDEIVVEIHSGGNARSISELSYRVGKVSGPTVIWGEDIPYGKGEQPSIAINKINRVNRRKEPEKRNIVVVAHTVNGSIYYSVGEVTGKSIEWLSRDVDTQREGTLPTVAINEDGTLVEVCQSKNNTLSYRVGKLDTKFISTGDISWGKSYTYDSGQTPSIGITNGGVVVEIHKDKAIPILRYKVGDIIESGSLTESIKTIQWREADPQGNNLYIAATNVSLAISESGEVVSVMEVGDQLFQISGMVNGKKIAWTQATTSVLNLRQYRYTNPKVAMSSNAKLAIQVYSYGSLLQFSTSRLMDTTNYFGDMLPLIGHLPLKKMVFPATHDSGMYLAERLSALGRTQDESLLEQLNSGSRYFDLRVDDYLNIWHGVTRGPNLVSVILDIQTFISQHGLKELVILKFSHFEENFSAASYLKMKGLLYSGLNPWMYREKPPGKRLADITMNEYLVSGSKILIVIDDSGDKGFKWAFDPLYKEPGFWVYRDWDSECAYEGDLTVFDQYSKTTDYDVMKQKQFGHLAEFNGKCKSYPGSIYPQDTPCDLFLLSWTLTPATWVDTFAKYANGRLGEDMNPIGINNHGFFANILYLDYFENARPAFIAKNLLKKYNDMDDFEAPPFVPFTPP